MGAVMDCTWAHLALPGGGGRVVNLGRGRARGSGRAWGSGRGARAMEDSGGTGVGGPATGAGSAGPAGRHAPPASAKTPAVPGWAQLPASSGVPEGLNAAEVRSRRPHRVPAADVATDLRAARVVKLAPPGPDSSAVPLASSASSRPLPGSAASASGTSASAASRTPGDHAEPSSLVVASGVKTSSWLGRNPATRDRPASGATTRLPLLATPGGVTRRQLALPAGRANSCQKLLCWAAGPPMTVTAHVPPAVSTAVARDGGAGAADGALACRAAEPQPLSSAPASSRRETALRGRFTATSVPAARRRPAARRTTTW